MVRRSIPAVQALTLPVPVGLSRRALVRLWRHSSTRSMYATWQSYGVYGKSTGMPLMTWRGIDQVEMTATESRPVVRKDACSGRLRVANTCFTR